MASTISKVTNLDKEMRIKVKKLEGKREKLPEFLREKKKELVKKIDLESKLEIEARESEIDRLLTEAKKDSEKELKKFITVMESSYKENKDKWIEKIYNQCIEDYMGD